MTKTGKIIVTVIAILTVIITLTVIGIVYFFSSYTSAILINEGINLPRPKKEERKITQDYREGEEFVILRYDKKNINKIKNIKNTRNERIFKKISKDNVEEVKEKTAIYYKNLSSKEEEIFDNSISIKELMQYGNYYRIYEKRDCVYSIIIIYKNNLYYMSIVEPPGFCDIKEWESYIK